MACQRPRHLRVLLLIAVFISALVPVTWADGTRTVRSGPELAAAFADESVSLVIVERHDPQGVLTLADGDFQGIAVPVRLARNLTISGSSAAPPLWPLLQLPAKLKVQLADGVTLRWQHVILEKFRDENMLRAPGIDLLVPSMPGTTSAFLEIKDAAAVSGVGYPTALMKQNFAAVPRLPGAPGAQNYSIMVPQPGCVNDTTAPLLERCWAINNRLYDVQMLGLDVDTTGRPTPNNYAVCILNLTSVGLTMLSEDCIREYGPIGCNLVTTRNKSSTLQLLPPPPPPAENAAAGSQQLLLGNGTGAGANKEFPVGLVVGSIVGGVAVVICAVALLGAFVLRKQWQPAAPGLPPAGGMDSPNTVPIHPSKMLGGGGHKASKETLPTSSGPLCTLRPTSRGHIIAPTVDDVVTSSTPIDPEVFIGVHVVTDPEGTESKAAAAAIVGCGLDSIVDDDWGPAPGDVGHGPAAELSTGNININITDTHVDVVKLRPVVLGKGAFGRVYEGTYRGQRVAVKQVLDLSEGATMELLQASFAQELEVLGRCKHPNIVHILAADLNSPRPCLVMELMDMSLDKLLTLKLLPMPLVLHIAREIALGLAYLHPTILHRDLKPGNVLINDPWGKKPIVKLSDFGVSRLRHTALVTAFPEAGTPAYMAPECFDVENLKITHQSDIYSYGVLLWQMLAGCPPWEGNEPVAIACQVTLMGKRLQVHPKGSPGSCSSRWPPQLCHLLHECWDKDPERRPAAEELAKRLMLLQQKLQGRGSSMGNVPDVAGPPRLLMSVWSSFT